MDKINMLFFYKYKNIYLKTHYLIILNKKFGRVVIYLVFKVLLPNFKVLSYIIIKVKKYFCLLTRNARICTLATHSTSISALYISIRNFL